MSTLGSLLAASRESPTLRFITCGSVDDGKSSLIGRLLHESKSIFDDQLQALATDSKKFGTQGGRLDLALLLDGLQAEREQGITIDVAYRFFSTPRRKFIVADTPGHEQYTRNMATGASTADLAVLLLDARKGVLQQTRRHARIVSMMGIRHVVLAVNKMDLVDYSAVVFEEHSAAFRAACAEFNFATIQAIPLSALDGDNVTRNSTSTPWYDGPPLLKYLEDVDASPPDLRSVFRMPVQWVNRPNLDFRGMCGRIAEGTVRPGDRVRVMPSGVATTVKKIIVWEGELDDATRGDSVTLVLADEVDVSRGDVLVSCDAPTEISSQFEARLIWLGDEPLLPGRQYILMLHRKEVVCSVTAIKFLVDVNTGAHLAGRSLELNQIAEVTISTSQAVAFEPYTLNRTMGGFVLVDKLTFATVGAGMLVFALRRASNIHWQALAVGKTERAAIKLQTPRCVWFTGLSGSGKSTIANLLEKRLHAEGAHTYLLDGDNVRHGLNRDLGFTAADRVENIRRVAEVAKLMVDAGLVVIVSFISPFCSERRLARDLFAQDEFLEVFVDTPLDVCEQRDPKGLYAKARRGELRNFTGVDSEYERPEAPEVHLETLQQTPEECVDRLFALLMRDKAAV